MTRPYLAPHRLAGATRDLDAIYRRHDGLDQAREQYLQDMRDRMNRRAAVLREQRRIGIACIALSAFVVVYMAAQFLRLVAF